MQSIRIVTSTQTIDSKLQTATIEECVEYCKSKSVLGVDTETEGLDFTCKKMIMFQIGDLERQFVIDTRFVSIEPLREVLESESILKIFHNAKFDYKFIKKWAGISCVNIYDTYLVEKVLNCGKDDYGYSLATLLKRYFKVTLEKAVRNEFVDMTGQPFTESQIVYGAKDVEYLIQLRDKQLPIIAERELEMVVNLENAAVVVFSEIEFEGLDIDKKAWKELAKTNSLELKAKELELDNMVLAHPKLAELYTQPVQAELFKPIEEVKPTHINWNSPSQILKLFQVLESKIENVNGKELSKLRKKHKLIDAYVIYKEVAKKANAYGEGFFKYLAGDGKVHTNFNQILDTGRVSSREPNMQQIPASNAYRNCFVAPEGWVFVSSDYSSQELNVIAFGSQDPVFLEALEKGQDLHSVCADLVFGDKWKEAADDGCAYMVDKSKCKCKEHGKLRTQVKSINFGLAYGMGPHKLADTLDIKRKEAEELIEDYFKAFPKIKVFLESLGNFGKSKGYIRTFRPFKRKRWFSSWFPGMHHHASAKSILGSIERASKNTPIQGSSADMTKLALIKIYDEIKANWEGDVKIVMTVHDQIDTICKKEVAETWKEKMTELMEEAAKVIIKNGLLKADTNISDTWEK